MQGIIIPSLAPTQSLRLLEAVMGLPFGVVASLLLCTLLDVTSDNDADLQQCCAGLLVLN